MRVRTTRLHPTPHEEKHETPCRRPAQRAQRGPRPARSAEVTWRRSETHGIPAADFVGGRERMSSLHPVPLV